MLHLKSAVVLVKMSIEMLKAQMLMHLNATTNSRNVEVEVRKIAHSVQF